MATEIASLLVKVGADTRDAEAALGRTDAAFQKTGKSAESAAEKFDKRLTQASIVGTAAIAAIGTAAIFTAAEFERGLDQVGAISGATERDLGRLRKEALAIGADTAFGAGQALAAMEELAAGGRSVDQILVEARASADLAAAGNYNLADSARTVATVMDIWREEGVQTTEVVNRLAGAANVSRFGVEDMAMAIAQGGGAAKVAGVEFGDFATTIALTASAFNSGSDAGTSFKTFVTALPGNSNEAKDAIKELGLEFFDASGNMRSMAEITEELRTKLGPLSEEQQNVALKTIFGNDALRTAAMLMRSTGEEFEAMSNTLRTTDASVIAAQRMSNLHGDIEELTGSLETLAIAFGSQALPALSGAAQLATDATNAFGALPQSTQNVIAGFTALTVAIPALVAGTDKVIQGLGLVGEAGLTMRSKMALAAASIGAVAVGLDYLSNRTTGVGLFDRVFGDVTRSQAANEALREWNAILSSAGPNVDRASLATARFAEVLDELPAAFEQGFSGGAIGGFFENLSSQVSGVTGLDAEFHRAIRSTKEWEETVKRTAAAMADSGVSALELARAYHALPPEMRASFDAATDIEYLMTTTAFAMESARDATDGWMGSIQDLLPKEADLADMTGVGEDAISSWGAAMRDAIAAGDDFNDVLGRITDTYSTMHPQADILRAQHASLTFELEQLKLKGDDATASEKERARVIEKELLPAIDKQVKSFDIVQAAAEGLEGQVIKLLGPTGFAGLKDAMDNASRSGPEQVGVMSTLTDAYAALYNKDIPTLVAKFDELRGELSPAEWRALTQSSGYATVAGFVEGVNRIDVAREMHEALIEPVIQQDEMARNAGYGVGLATVEGMQAGLASAAAAAAVEQSARAIARNAITWMREEIDSDSPSREAADLVGLPLAQGIAMGMREGEPLVIAEAEAIVQKALSAMQGEWVKVGADLGGSTVPSWVIANSPYLRDHAMPGGTWSAGEPNQSGYVPTGAYGQPLAWDQENDTWTYPWLIGGAFGERDSSGALVFHPFGGGSHKDGLNRVPHDNYVATLHRDEAVLTASDADIWRSISELRKALGTSGMDHVPMASTLSAGERILREGVM